MQGNYSANPMPRCRAFTLAEMVLSLAITSILLGGMASLVLIASRSIPGTKTQATAATSSAAALEQFAADVSVATTIVNASATQFEFTVPDRDGDGKEEGICYAWQGGPADALQRAYNAGKKTDVIGPLSAFSLSYQRSSTTSGLASTTNVAPEGTILTWSAGALGGLLYTGYALSSGNMLAQNIRPSLAANARSWKITRIQFYAQSDLLATGSIEVQLRTTDATGLPTSTILAKAAVLESSLPLLLYGYNDALFTSAPELAPNQEVALVFVCAGSCPSGTLGYTTLAIGRTTPMATTSGAVWATSTLNVMPHVIYGTVTSTTANSVQSNRLTQVGVQMQVKAANSPMVRTSINLNNTPGAM